jgi:NitT/TauT family transport system substrate-binding protein
MGGKDRRGVTSCRYGLLALLGAGVLAACASPPPPVPAAGASAAGGGAPAAAAGSAPVEAGAARGREAYPAAGDAEVQIRAAWCAVAGAMFPLWVAKEAGIFQRHKLDVELIYTQGSEVNLAALARGDIDFLECAGGTTPGLMAGSDGAFIANLYLGNPYRLIVAPDIQRVADLRGRKLAISRPGEWDNRLTEVLLERHGLVANQDVAMVPVGGQTDRYNALKAGVVDGTTVNPPVNLAAQNEGFREIYNLSDLNFSGVYISLYTTRRTLQDRPRLVERFLAAMVEASAYAKADREFTIRVMGDYLKLTDRQALEGAYQAYAVEMLAIPPVVPLEAVQAVIDETLRLNPDAPIREAALLVDNRPLQAVQASGFVDAVLAEYPSAR